MTFRVKPVGIQEQATPNFVTLATRCIEILIIIQSMLVQKQTKSNAKEPTVHRRAQPVHTLYMSHCAWIAYKYCTAVLYVPLYIPTPFGFNFLQSIAWSPGPGGCSPGKCIPLLGRHRETLTGTKTKKIIPLLAHNMSRNPYPYWHKNRDRPTLCGTTRRKLTYNWSSEIWRIAPENWSWSAS